MIRCKAGFKTSIKALCVSVVIELLYLIPCQNLLAHEYIPNPLYGFDSPMRDYTIRHVRDTVRVLLVRSEFKVPQTGYANSSGNITNIQIATDFKQLAVSGFAGLAPDDIDRDLYNAERFTVRFYESLARRWDRLNPIPGLYYGITVRNAAYPFVFMEALQTYAYDMGTYPFTDDLFFRKTALLDRQYGFSFQIVFN